MSIHDDIIGRKSLAQILNVSESTTRNLERAGLIAPEAIVDGRALFSAKKARALRVARENRELRAS